MYFRDTKFVNAASMAHIIVMTLTGRIYLPHSCKAKETKFFIIIELKAQSTGISKELVLYGLSQVSKPSLRILLQQPKERIG